MDNTSAGAYLRGQIIFEHNLVAINGKGLDFEVNSTEPQGGVQYNTIINNKGYGIEIRGEQAGSIPWKYNNLLGNTGYDLYLSTPRDIDAGGTYWGDLPAYQVPSRIYDCNDKEFGCPDTEVGEVTYHQPSSTPILEAPAFARTATVDPALAGIETATFDVTFSRPLDTSVPPTVTFHSAKRGTSTIYTEEDGLASNNVQVIAQGSVDSVWFGCNDINGTHGLTHFDGEAWTTFSIHNSGISDKVIYELVQDSRGELWATHPNSISRWDGNTWITYSEGNTGGMVHDGIRSIDETPDGSMWFTLQWDGVVRFDGATWYHFGEDDGLPSRYVEDLAVDQQGHVWIAASYNGVAVYDGASWVIYDDSTGSPLSRVRKLFADSSGRIWLVPEFSDWQVLLIKWEDGRWTDYNQQNTEYTLNGDIRAIAEAPDGAVWFSSGSGEIAIYDNGNWRKKNLEDPQDVYTMVFDSHGNLWTNHSWDSGTKVFWHGSDYFATNNTQWIDDTHYRVTYNITSLVPRGEYDVVVSGGLSAGTIISGTQSLVLPAGGMPVPAAASGNFSVDYAGEVTDGTAPNAPAVSAAGKEGEPGTVQASWSANDPESEITGYRYAIGTSSSSTDIVNWTDTTKTNMIREHLGLTEGEQYWVSVQARNAGGLWSISGYDAFTSGQPIYRVLLPLVLRNR